MWHNVKQNSDEPCPCCGKTWMELRAGKVTGSNIGRVMANYGKAFGDPAKSLAASIAAHQLGGSATTDNYTNAHMERGHEQEPIAIALYEDEYFSDVSPGGFYDNGNTGCSPDGNVYEDGLNETKCVIAGVQYATVKRGKYDPKYKWQLIFNLKESNRMWIDYASYCSELPRDKKLFVFRIYSEYVGSWFGMIDQRLEQFFNLVEDVKNTFSKAG